MRAPAKLSISRLGMLVLAFAAMMLAASIASIPAIADEPGDRAVDASAEDAPTLAGHLADGMLRISTDVSLAEDSGEPLSPVIGSFTVNGFAYAIVGEGQVALVAADVLADEPSAAFPGTGAGADEALDGPGGGALALPESVAYDGTEYVVTSIGPRAFAGRAVGTIVIPATIELIDGLAFRDSPITSVEVADGSIGLSSFDGMLFDADQTSLLLVPEGKQGAARLPSTAEVVDPSSFSHSADVVAIDVEAGSAAFSSRNGLLYDASGETLVRVPAGATDIQIADGCTTVAAGSMEGCVRLERISAPASVTTVSRYAFEQEAFRVPSLSHGVMGEADSFEAMPREGPLADLSSGDTAPSVDPAVIHVLLEEGVDGFAWRNQGFLIQGTDGEQDADSVDGALAEADGPVALVSTQEAASYGADAASYNYYAGIAKGGGGSLTLVSVNDVEKNQTGITDKAGILKTSATRFRFTAYHEQVTIYAKWESGTSDYTYVIRAVPQDGYYFAGWNCSPYADDDSTFMYSSSTNPSCLWVDGTLRENFLKTDYDVYAVFKPYPSYFVQVAGEGTVSGVINDEIAGTVRPVVDDYRCGIYSTAYEDWDVKLGKSGEFDIQVLQKNGQLAYQSKGKVTPKPGYKFVGWSTSEDGSGLTSTVNLTGSQGGGFVRYAIMTPSIFTITLNNNNGKDGTSTIYLKYATGWYSDAAASSGITKVVTPSRSGWEFQGYEGISKNGYKYTYITSAGSINNSSAWWSDFVTNTTLTAKWKKVIKLDKNGGSGGSASITCTDSLDGVGYSSVSPPTLTGWTFRGYCDDNPAVSYARTNPFLFVNADGSRVTSRKLSDYDTLYAWWTKSIALDASSDDASAGTVTQLNVAKGQKVGLKMTTVTSSHVDYALHNLFQVELTSNDSRNLKLPSWKNNDKDEWVFAGYYESPTGAECYVTSTGSGYTACESSMPSTLYAKWVKTLNLDMRDGAGGSEKISFTYGTTEYSYLPTVTPPKLPGWTFRGYCDDETTNPYQYILADGTVNPKRADLSSDLSEYNLLMRENGSTLYAWWTREVTLDPNGGTAGERAKVTVQKGKPLGLLYTTSSLNQDLNSLFWADADERSKAKPSRDGYAFSGFYDSANGTTKFLDSNCNSTAEAVVSTAPAVVYAHWSLDTYSITYTCNACKQALPCKHAANPATNKASFTVNDLDFTVAKADAKLGYETSGWTGGTLQGGVVTSDQVSNADSVTVSTTGPKSYAMTPSAIGYKVTTHGNGGAFADGASEKERSFTIESASFSLEEPSWGGHTFAGWNTEADGSGDSFPGTVEKGSTGDRTYHAQWSTDPYQITYNLEGGSLPEGEDNPRTYDYDTADFDLPVPSREGYAFTGWVGSNGSEPQREVTIRQGSWGDLSFTACWQANAYIIRFDLGSEGRPYWAGNEPKLPDGTSGLATTYDGETTLPAPKRAGHVFSGWAFMEGEGDDAAEYRFDAGVPYGPASNERRPPLNLTAEPDGEAILVARWTASLSMDVPSTVTLTAFTDWENGVIRVTSDPTDPVLASRTTADMKVVAIEDTGADPDWIFGEKTGVTGITVSAAVEGATSFTVPFSGGVEDQEGLEGFLIPAVDSGQNPRLPVRFGIDLSHLELEDLTPWADPTPVAQLCYTVAFADAGV